MAAFDAPIVGAGRVTPDAKVLVDGSLAPPDWPAWPASTERIEQAVLDVLRSQRWSVSGMRQDGDSRERRFGREFASFTGVNHGVPTTNGSAALVCALTALGIGYGDEVLVPGLAWVACASAVARVGAVPVFVDLEAETYAMNPSSAEELVGPRTVAVIVVHLSSSIADLDLFQSLAARNGLALVEDCSQAHGAVWRGSRVGSFGALGAFSFQSSKLLTAGEGGIVVTDDPHLAAAAQQARADGREWSSGAVVRGLPDLVMAGRVQGHNHCMTEMQAAILSASLPMLDEQNRIREEAVHYLEAVIEGVDGVRILRRRGDSRVDMPTFWHVPVQLDSDAFGGFSTEQVRVALSQRAGLFLEPVGSAIPESPIYNPQLYQRFPEQHRSLLRAATPHLEVSRMLAETCFTIPHHALLASRSTLDRLLGEVVEVQRLAQGSRLA